MKILEDDDERPTGEILAASYTVACFGLRGMPSRATFIFAQ